MKSELSMKSKISMKSELSKISSFVFIIVFALVFVNPAQAAENSQNSIHLDKATIEKGYTVSSFSGQLKLSLVPGVFKTTTKVDTEIIAENMPLPWRLEKASGIYQFDFRNKDSYNHDKPFYIQLSYENYKNYHKQVFFYDKNFNKWRPLPSTDHPEKGFIRSLIHLPFARIAVFANPDILNRGRASWYAYKGGAFVASPDFPKGSRLRVVNLENQKFIDVEVNDYGPDRSIFPKRVVDLDKEAFARVADPGEGVIEVKVKPLYIPSEESYKITGVKNRGAEVNPAIGAQAGLIWDNQENKTVWQKNSAQLMPLASLSKLIALKVFLDREISPEKEVFYQKEDALYNYQYCNSWESAKVGLRDGEIVKIKDLIYASLVGSANNAVESLVRESGLSRSEFIREMNNFVQSLGAKDTYFEEPTGLSPKNVSSARDYAIISKEVFKEPLIRKASTRKTYEFTTINSNRALKLKNTNSMISRPDNIPGIEIIGSKTGYLHEAGYCLVVNAENTEGENIIAIILKDKSRRDSFEEMEDLLKYGFKAI